LTGRNPEACSSDGVAGVQRKKDGRGGHKIEKEKERAMRGRDTVERERERERKRAFS